MAYPFKTKPFNHQLEALRDIWHRRWGGAVFFESGTGKTKVALDWVGALYRYKDIKKVLVVCPLAAFGVWPSEAEKHLPPEVPYKITYVNKSKTVGRLFSDVYHPSRLLIVVVNYETAWHVISQLALWKPEVVILDESHKIKRISTKRSQAMHKLGLLVNYRMILT